MRVKNSVKPFKSSAIVGIIIAIIILAATILSIHKISGIQKDIESQQTKDSDNTKGRVWMDRATKAHKANSHDIEIEHLLKSANLGYAPAIWKIGLYYDTGDHVALSYDTAREWYAKLPKKTYAQYLANRGYALVYPGTTLEQSQKGVGFLQEAFSLGNEKARENLAWAYSRSYPELRDVKLAKEYYEIIGGKAELEFLNHQGWQLKKKNKIAEARVYFQRAIDLGSPRALLNMAYSYQDDHQDKDGDKVAAQFMQKASKENDKFTRFESAMYFLRYGNIDTRSMSRDILEKLADEDFDKAHTELAKIYTDSVHFKKDYIKAAKHMEKAEYLTPKLKLKLGHMKRTGTGIKADPKAAFDIYTSEMNNGNANATLALAHMTRLGLGTQKNPDKALELYQSAKTNENHLANYYIGLMHENGDFGQIDTPKAIEMYLRASKNNYGPALRRIALKQETGNRLPKNPAKAFETMSEAAYSGDKEAIEHLTRYYTLGIGTDINLEVAKIWSEKKTVSDPFLFEESMTK